MDLEQVYQQSYQRILDYEQRQGDFFALFYRNFMDSSNQVAEKFRHTQMETQITLLKNFLVHLQAFHKHGKASDQLQQVARSHSAKILDIPHPLYDLWLAALLKTLKQCDCKYSNDVANAWTLVLTPGINYMKQHY